MNISQHCFTLFPSGTLGRVFIDVALEIISTIQPVSINYRFDTVCINSDKLLIDAVASIIEKTKARQPSFFPLTGNDANSLKKRLLKFDQRNPISIIEYVVDLIKGGGYNRLKETITAPLIMRVEFYEYAKEGYAQYRKATTHPYRETTVLDLGLAVIGSLVTHTATVRMNGDFRYYYFIPLLKNMRLEDLNDLKNIIDGTLRIFINQGKTLGAVTTYKVASGVFKTGLTNIDSIIGELLIISSIGRRYSLLSRELLGTCGWIWLFNRLRKESSETLDLIINVIDTTMKRTRYKSLSPLYSVVDELFRYIQCDESALYRAVRLLNTAIDTLKKAMETRTISDEWEIVYKNISISRINYLIEDLGSLAEETPCLERVVS